MASIHTSRISFSIILNVIALLWSSHVTDYKAPVEMTDLLDGYFLAGIVIMAGIAYAIANLTARICPKPKLGVLIYGTLYGVFAGMTLDMLCDQDSICKVVAGIVVPSLAVGTMSGLVAAYRRQTRVARLNVRLLA